MASDIFSKAKTYRKKHPKTAWLDCVKAVAKKSPAKKATAVGGKKKKRVVIVKVSGTKKKKAKPIMRFSIGAVSHSKLGKEMQHQKSLVNQLNYHIAKLKDKGLSVHEKNHLRSEIKNYRSAIQHSKKHITNLKKTIK